MHRRITAQTSDIREFRDAFEAFLFPFRFPTRLFAEGRRAAPLAFFGLLRRGLDDFTPRFEEDAADLPDFSSSLPADFLRLFELDLPFADEGLCFFPAMAHLSDLDTRTL